MGRNVLPGAQTGVGVARGADAADWSEGETTRAMTVTRRYGPEDGPRPTARVRNSGQKPVREGSSYLGRGC